MDPINPSPSHYNRLGFQNDKPLFKINNGFRQKYGLNKYVFEYIHRAKPVTVRQFPTHFILVPQLRTSGTMAFKFYGNLRVLNIKYL